MKHNIKTSILLALSGFLLLAPGMANAQGTQTKGDTVELTSTDFAKLSSFNGAHATLFGIALGMGRDQAKQKIKNYLYLKLKADPFNPKRFYIQDASNDTGNVPLAYLKWPNYDSGLYQIVVYPAMAKYLRGVSASIVSPDCMDSSSQIFKTFLGKPTGSQVTLNVPSIKSKTTMFYYPKYSIVIEEDQNGDETNYDLVLTHKW